MITGFANCVDHVHRIEQDEILDEAELLPEQIELIKNYKEDKKNKYLLKNSVAKSNDN